MCFFKQKVYLCKFLKNMDKSISVWRKYTYSLYLSFWHTACSRRMLSQLTSVSNGRSRKHPPMSRKNWMSRFCRQVSITHHPIFIPNFPSAVDSLTSRQMPRWWMQNKNFSFPRLMSNRHCPTCNITLDWIWNRSCLKVLRCFTVASTPACRMMLRFIRSTCPLTR